MCLRAFPIKGMGDGARGASEAVVGAILCGCKDERFWQIQGVGVCLWGDVGDG